MSEITPILSIIIPCYNHGEYIEETIASIENAKDRYPIEIIIVNDGSTDENTLFVLKKIEEKGYFVLNQKNGGLGNARNNGIKLSKGKYILPLDSDNNVLYPYLNDAIEFLETNNDYDIIFGDAKFIGEKSGNWIIGEYNLQKIMIENYIDACAVFRKKCFDKTSGYDEKMPSMGWEDWDFWLNNTFNNFKFYYLKQFSFEYRVLKNSMIHSKTKSEIELNLSYILRKYNNYLNFNVIQSYFSYHINDNIHEVSKNIFLKNIFVLLKLKISYILKKCLKN
jgi:glycosyltransferase involved in cell wall biosynthesis